MVNAGEQGQRGNVKEGSCAHVRVFVCACSLSSYFGANVFVHSHVSRLMFCVRCAMLVVQRTCVFCVFVLVACLVVSVHVFVRAHHMLGVQVLTCSCAHAHSVRASHSSLVFGVWY